MRMGGGNTMYTLEVERTVVTIFQLYLSNKVREALLYRPII